MKRVYWLLIFLITVSKISLHAQTTSLDSIKFFTDEELIHITITGDLKQLQLTKGENVFEDAKIFFKFPDSSMIDEKIKIAPRGHFRRDYCNIPPLLLNFRNATSPRLSSLGKLKLVIGCGKNAEDEQLLLKEYLVYKIYNQLEDKSFRVRLVKVTYNDTRNKIKPFSQFAFFIEDDGELAKRNGCKKGGKVQYLTENTHRETMTKVAIFEYLISNGDWSVPNNHNIKLIFKKGEQTEPYAVPYDFDHSGFVNASYATPNELLGTEKVTDRAYRGFPRNMDELEVTLDLFRDKKKAITSLISDFQLLAKKVRNELIDYVKEFYDIINNKRLVQSIFIDNARTR